MHLVRKVDIWTDDVDLPQQHHCREQKSQHAERRGAATCPVRRCEIAPGAKWRAFPAATHRTQRRGGVGDDAPQPRKVQFMRRHFEPVSTGLLDAAPGMVTIYNIMLQAVSASFRRQLGVAVPS